MYVYATANRYFVLTLFLVSEACHIFTHMYVTELTSNCSNVSEKVGTELEIARQLAS